MMLLVVLAVWAGLALLAGGLFVAVIRGGGGTDLPELAPEAAEVVLPAQRVPAVEVPARVVAG